MTTEKEFYIKLSHFVPLLYYKIDETNIEALIVERFDDEVRHLWNLYGQIESELINEK